MSIIPMSETDVQEQAFQLKPFPESGTGKWVRVPVQCRFQTRLDKHMDELTFEELVKLAKVHFNPKPSPIVK